jgi:hypothetical protein
MDNHYGDYPHPTQLHKAAYYLLASIFLGTGVFFIVQGIAQLWP